MPSDYVTDLIDHKRRVGLYLQKFTEKLFQQIIDKEDRTDPTQMSLVDLTSMFCSSRGFIQPAQFGSQVSDILEVTSKYLKEQHLDTYTETLRFFTCELFQRAVVHDNSKFSLEEFELYEAAFPYLQKYAYGSTEFKAELRKIQPAIEHHYAVNDHHIEFFWPGDIADMNLIQITEMICDWLAASERSQTDIKKGLEMNKQRFGIGDQLLTMIGNTIFELRG
jgi:hypothetical protein